MQKALLATEDDLKKRSILFLCLKHLLDLDGEKRSRSLLYWRELLLLSFMRCTMCQNGELLQHRGLFHHSAQSICIANKLICKFMLIEDVAPIRGSAHKLAPHHINILYHLFPNTSCDCGCTSKEWCRLRNQRSDFMEATICWTEVFAPKMNGVMSVYEPTLKEICNLYLTP